MENFQKIKTLSGHENDSPPIEQRLKFERLLSDLSAKYVRIQDREVDKEIENDFISLVTFLGVDRCSLAQFSRDLKSLTVTHTYSIPSISRLSYVRFDKKIPWYTEKCRKHETVNVHRVELLPPEAELDKQFLLQHHTKSNLAIPLKVGDELLGIFGLATTRWERSWPDPLVNRLKLIGEVFANALMRQLKQRELDRAFTEIKKLKDQLQNENIYLKQQIKNHQHFKEFLGSSQPIRHTLDQIEKVAKTNSTVLLLGETGTGKELLAKAIHDLSCRGDRSMVKVNCAAIPSTLMESELFGHEKGAFTGAAEKKKGRFELANGSTLFLDEISEISVDLQAKLLRILQEQQFERLGSNQTINVDLRIVAATNQNMEKAVKLGRFREDLFYRLNVFPIHIPPLRERKDDIAKLVEFFIHEFNEKMGKKIRNVSGESMNEIMQYSWPGNVRELRNVVERAMIMSSGRYLEISLPNTKRHEHHARTGNLSLDETIKKHLYYVLEKTNWKVSGKGGAAEILKLPPTTLESKMKKLGIHRPSAPGRSDLLES